MQTRIQQGKTPRERNRRQDSRFVKAPNYLTELQCHFADVFAAPSEAGRLCLISSNLAGCSLARIVEEELIAVEIIDHQKPVAP